MQHVPNNIWSIFKKMCDEVLEPCAFQWNKIQTMNNLYREREVEASDLSYASNNTCWQYAK